MSPQFLPAVRVRLRVSADLSGGVLGGVVGGVVGGVTACLLVATSASASTGGAVPMMGRSSATSVLALADLPRSAADHHPLLRQRAPEGPMTGQRHGAGRSSGTAHGATSHGATPHGTDTSGGDGSATDRDLALAATWHVDPTLLQPHTGDSAATRESRAELARVAAHLQVVMGRYHTAGAAARHAAADAAKARAELDQARTDAAAAHRVYVRDHRLLVQMVVTSYEQGPVTSMQFLLTVRSAHDVMVGVGTMQQIGSNEASVVADAETSAVKMRETAASAQDAAAAAQAADQKAHETLDAATAAGQKVLAQLDKARNVLTLSVLADQMQATLADAMKYADQLKPGSVSFPLPPHSGFYDNHNWGQRSAHWASIHTGDDYSVACGTPVLAATAGKIEILTDQAWAGRWLVMVSTGQGGLTTWYAHMEALTVRPGQHVKPGQVIGRVGEAGNATGCHLHFELHPDGGSIYQDTTDPDPWLKAVGALPGG